MFHPVIEEMVTRARTASKAEDPSAAYENQKLAAGEVVGP